MITYWPPNCEIVLTSSLVTPVATEAVTLAEAKAWLRLNTEAGDTSESSLPIWEWAVQSNAAPVATGAGQSWITKGDYASGETVIPDGSIITAKVAGASVINADPSVSQYWINS